MMTFQMSRHTEQDGRQLVYCMSLYVPPSHRNELRGSTSHPYSRIRLKRRHLFERFPLVTLLNISGILWTNVYGFKTDSMLY